MRFLCLALADGLVCVNVAEISCLAPDELRLRCGRTFDIDEGEYALVRQYLEGQGLAAFDSLPRPGESWRGRPAQL
jgi:hypothetical protein